MSPLPHSVKYLAIIEGDFESTVNFTNLIHSATTYFQQQQKNYYKKLCH